MIDAQPDVTTTLFTLPPDAKFLPVADLSARLRARIGVVDDGHAVITRPGFRVTTRLVPRPLAGLITEFRAPSLLTDGVLRFARTHDQEPQATLDLAFDALASLVEARMLVPEGSPDASAPSPSLAAGQEFAGFEIASLVRSLEDSEVYRAQGRDGTVAALKIARPDRPGVAAMMANEARVLGDLGGADSPRFLSAGVEGGRAYVAMEWCDGVSIAVAAQQARASRDRPRLHALVGRMFAAYGRLHAAGVLHGDIHPGNCLVRDDGRVVILDFGVARPVANAGAVDLLRSGIPQFHDPQMAEAVLAGVLTPAATPASEQYGLAVLAYLLLTGLPPIEAPAEHDELLRRIVERRPLPFAARGVPDWPEVEAVVGRALAKDPRDRFPDVASLGHAFSAAGTAAPATGRVPPTADDAFDDAVDAVRGVAVPAGSLDHVWFALRAALVLEDAELLAAADVLAREAAPGWAAQSIAALVARARSDVQAERMATSGLLAAVEPLPLGREAAVAVAAAAAVLEGGAVRSPEAARLGAWAAERLDGLFVHASSRPGRVSLSLPGMHAALALARTGVVAPRVDLLSRLETLLAEGQGDIWLWALAHDIYADERFRERALIARLPRQARHRGLALLRRYQLTGDGRWVAEAKSILVNAPSPRVTAIDTALLVAELKAPERAMRPLFSIT